MFTGLIEDVGTLKRRTSRPDGARVAFETAIDLDAVAIGDSVAVNGVCLTVVLKAGRQFFADVSAETLARTTLGGLALGARVNLEQALRVGDRLGGHLVQGHVDGVGRFVDTRRVGDGWDLTFELPEALLSQVVEKGSIALDGVSLTVARLEDPRVTIAVVPHTGAMTNLMALAIGAPVNVETDVIGKYVERVLGRGRGAAEGLTRESLEALGFA